MYVDSDAFFISSSLWSSSHQLPKIMSFSSHFLTLHVEVTSNQATATTASSKFIAGEFSSPMPSNVFVVVPFLVWRVEGRQQVGVGVGCFHCVCCAVLLLPFYSLLDVDAEQMNIPFSLTTICYAIWMCCNAISNMMDMVLVIFCQTSNQVVYHHHHAAHLLSFNFCPPGLCPRPPSVCSKYSCCDT